MRWSKDMKSKKQKKSAKSAKSLSREDSLHKIPLRITDTTLRDAHQSLWATRMRTQDILEIIDCLDEEKSECDRIERTDKIIIIDKYVFI